MALDEAIRPVTVREGDKVSEIPAMQALIRTMFRAAAQGDTKAGRQLMELINRAESGRTGTALEILEHAVQYKSLTENECESFQEVADDIPCDRNIKEK